MDHNHGFSRQFGEVHNAESARLSAIAAVLLETYRRRDQVFGGNFLAATAWEALLVLQVHAEGLPLDRISEELGASPALTQRWLNILIGQGTIAACTREGVDLYLLTHQGALGLADILFGARRTADLTQMQIFGEARPFAGMPSP